MTRIVAVLLLTCGVAVAAPVPKVAPKLADVFGAITEPNGEYTFDMQKGKALRVDVPPAEPGAKVPWKPQVAKTVAGDFVVTVRVFLAVPADAKAGEGKAGFASAGIAVSLGEFNGPRYCLQHTLGEETANGKTKWRSSVDGELKFFNGGGAGRRDMDVNPERSPVVLRLTRTGDTLLSEYQVADTKWQRLTTQRVRDLENTVLVGPVAFGNIEQKFSATFDEYEIRPLTEAKK